MTTIKDLYLVITKPNKGKQYYGGVYLTKEEARDRILYIAKNFKWTAKEKVEWTVQQIPTNLPVNFNSVMVIDGGIYEKD